MSGRSEVKQLIKELEKQGFTVVRTSGGHWKVTYPGRLGFVTLAFSPSGNPRHPTTMKRLRELGFKTGENR